MDGERSARRGLPLSLDDLRRRRDASAAEKSRLVFVPRAERGRVEAEDEDEDEDEVRGDKPEKHVAEVWAEERGGQGERGGDRQGRGRGSGNGRSERERGGLRREALHEVSRELSREAPREKPREALRGASREAPREVQRAGKRKFEKSAKSRHQERSRFKFEWDAGDDTAAGGAEDDLYADLRAKASAGSGGGGPDGGFSVGRGRVREGGRREESKDGGRFDVHWSKKSRERMTVRDWAIFREDFGISMRGPTGNTVKPARDWSETGLTEQLLGLVAKVGYAKPSPIQMCAVPIVLSGKDLIGLAETGSGKTAAFVLPMLTHIRLMPPMTEERAGDGPYALIMAPTRELVLQIETETRKFAGPLGYKVVAVIGGQGLEEQGLALQKGCEVVVCTPGRMMDLLSRQLAVLSNCNYVVLDEADRMIDMGFEPQVQEILSALPPPPTDDDGVSGVERRQMVMFSATMSPSVERLAQAYLEKPIIVTIGETGQAADAVDQRVEFLTSEGKKRDRLKSLVRELEPPVIVFANTKKGCEDVARLIESGGGSGRPLVLHSGKSQEQREQIFDSFKSGRAGILVATDLLGRGIDIKGVNHVINFELPSEMSKYTHRIGRTGRAGRKGTAWSLATSADADIFEALHAYLEQSGARVCREIARHNATRGNRGHIID